MYFPKWIQNRDKIGKIGGYSSIDIKSCEQNNPKHGANSTSLWHSKMACVFFSFLIVVDLPSELYFV